MGEEGGGAPGGAGFWVVDPIDGTTNYIRGFRHWGVSIAYVADGAVRIGVIYDAAVDKVYSAIKGQGAFKDGKPIRASAVTDPARAIAILGHSRRTDFAVTNGIATPLRSGIDYRRMGAAAIGLVGSPMASPISTTNTISTAGTCWPVRSSRAKRGHGRLPPLETL